MWACAVSPQATPTASAAPSSEDHPVAAAANALIGGVIRDRLGVAMGSVVLKSLSVLLGLFFIFIGTMKLTSFISKDLHKDLVSICLEDEFWGVGGSRTGGRVPWLRARVKPGRKSLTTACPLRCVQTGRPLCQYKIKASDSRNCLNLNWKKIKNEI